MRSVACASNSARKFWFSSINRNTSLFSAAIAARSLVNAAMDGAIGPVVLLAPRGE